MATVTAPTMHARMKTAIQRGIDHKEVAEREAHEPGVEPEQPEPEQRAVTAE